jgi:thiamine-monophosphate kinase
MNTCAERFGTSIIGGDTKESREINLTATAFGVVDKEHFMSRSGARQGDIVALTGVLGEAAAGLEALKRKFKRPNAIKALLEPMPRVPEGISLGATRAVTSCIDTSDGLSSSLHHLARSSGVGFNIDFESLPISKEVGKAGLDVEGAALHFGGEYELLMTIAPDKVDIARRAVEGHGCRFTIIGKVIEKGLFLWKDGKGKRLEDLGWEHFRPVKKVPRKRRGHGKGRKRKRAKRKPRKRKRTRKKRKR